MANQHVAKSMALIGLVILIGLGVLYCGLRIADCGLDPTAHASTSSELPSPIRVAAQGQPYLSFSQPIGLQPSAFSFQPGLVSLSLTQSDVDEDGVPDLISGYVAPSSGLITLHRGNVEALWPRHQGSGIRDQQQRTTDNGQRTHRLS